MSRERLLQRRVDALETLAQTVDALRTLSAQHFRAARAPLAAARAYRAEVESFLGLLAGSLAAAEPEGPPGVVLVTADLGLVGDYASRLAREALALREELGAGPLLCLGDRATGPLSRAGVVPHAVKPAPASAAGLTAELLALVDDLLVLRRRGELGPLWIVSARFEGAGHWSPVRTPLLPPRPPADAPAWTASPYCASAHLREVVLRETLHAALHESLLEALASEHGKRLMTTESARSWLDDRLVEARRRLSSIRRESATQEVLEISAAVRAGRRTTEAAS